MKSRAFHLNKWYLDCVGETGDSVICYSATLNWKRMSVAYASLLTLSGNAPKQKTSLLNVKQPEQIPDGLLWHSPGLNCRGLWRPVSARMDAITLYESAAGSVKWHCLQPISLVNASVGQDIYSGLGYVEHLEMTIEPWELPIDELRWGRFLSDNVYVVWIQWTGRYTLKKLFVNGSIFENAEISVDRVRWDEGNLSILNNSALRNGPIINTVLSKVPVLHSMVPCMFRNAHESKWLGCGVLKQGNEIYKGWVIHEVVRLQ